MGQHHDRPGACGQLESGLGPCLESISAKYTIESYILRYIADVSLCQQERFGDERVRANASLQIGNGVANEVRSGSSVRLKERFYRAQGKSLSSPSAICTFGYLLTQHLLGLPCALRTAARDVPGYFQRSSLKDRGT